MVFLLLYKVGSGSLQLRYLVLITYHSYYYFWPASMDPYHAHYWLVEFQNKNRCHRDTMLYLYILLYKLPYTSCLQILHVVSSCTASYPRFYSDLSITAAARSLAPPLGQSPPDTTTSKKPRLLDSKQISHRGPESVVSQYIAQPYSASFGFRPWFLQDPPPP